MIRTLDKLEDTMFRDHRRRTWTTVVLTGVLVAGCSELPTQPLDLPPLQASSQTVPAVEGAVTTLAVSTSKTVVGLVGGVVAAGDFKVVIPPGAIAGTATVTVTQPDPAKLECDLHITPESANRFSIPVTLVAKPSGLSLNVLRTAYISWRNPQTGQWERVPYCSVNLLTLTVQAPLWHFSQYRVEGKAGW